MSLSSTLISWFAGRGHQSVRQSRTNVLAFSSILLLLTVVTTPAQTTLATITGMVTDTSGAVVPNATVVVQHLATNISSKAASNDVGNYTLAQLKEGEYSLTATAPGFSERSVEGIVLVARDIRRIDLVLEVGTSKSVVEITAGATLIETDSPRLSDSKNSLVLGTFAQSVNRSVWAPLALSPNVLQSATSSTIRFAGSGSNQSRFTIDGITASDSTDGTQMGTLMNYLEWVAEVKVDMANNSADVGTIGQVTLISKSGTNQFHGSAFDYYSTHGFRARDPFAADSQMGVVHQPGFSAGGPVYLPKIYNGKNKTFFYTSYETTRGSAIYSFLQGTVPTQAMREGDFSSMLPGSPIYDPSTNEPFPGNRIPASRISSVSKQLQDRFFPIPNNGDLTTLHSNNYRLAVSRPKDYATYYTLRGDHNFSDRTSAYGRYTNNTVDYPYLWGALPALGQWKYGRFNHGALVSVTHAISPSLLSESRWGLSTDRIVMSGAFSGQQFVKDLGLQGLAPDLPDLPGMTGVSIQGLTGLSQTASSNSRQFMQDYQQYLSYFRGRHSLKLGFALTRAAADSLGADSALFGSVSFSNRFSKGSSYADFLLGIPTTTSRAFAPVPRDLRRWQYDVFISDDFRVNSKLTLNLGVRYELHLPWRDADSRMAVFDIKTGAIVVPDAALERVSPLFPSAFVGVMGADAAGLPQTLVGTDRNNIAPRIGVAYRPWGQNTVLRAGYGIFYDAAPYLPQTGPVAPFTLLEQPYTNPLSNPITFPQVFPASGTQGPAGVSLPSAVNPGLSMPLSMQYNFTAERQQWNMGFRVSYVGTAGRQSIWGYNYNSPVPDARPFISKPRPFPQFSGINYFTNGAGHQYNALTMEARRQMSKGLHFQASWTWARDIYDLTRLQIAENPFDRAREVAPSQDIPTHRFTSNMLYELPFGKGKHWLAGAPRLLDTIAGGWQISASYSMFSGQFLTPVWDGADPTGTAYSGSSTPAFVAIRPDILRDPNLPSDQRSVTQWYDYTAFAAPQAGKFGNSAKGVVKGPGTSVLHAGIYKSISFRENGPSLRLEFTGQNVLNHPNWNNPQMNVRLGGGFSGVISGAGGTNSGATGDMAGPRQLRAGIRLLW